ncbi:MAG: aminomethyl-transferring glycine dehydrogenase [Verrucomicrobia bacterium]|jgi:glycine dehydrogenase|nr:aminomethyl-transferring glycine dehydrogenase [Verrucomicrobiota bacterium]
MNDPAHPDRFVRRHIGPRPTELAEMLAALGQPSLDALTDAAVPESIRLTRKLTLAGAVSEPEALSELRTLASRNRVFRSFIGLGYHDTFTPAVIQRNILENPGWYTQYTPYQSEISQGRLEMLLNFQTMVIDLTALDIANASLLDEPTACAEAMMMGHRIKGAPGRSRFLVADTCHPQNIEVARTRALPLGVEVQVVAPADFQLDENVFGVLLQYPDTFGVIHDFKPLIERVHAAGALAVVATDLLALTVLRPPGEFGADIAVGSAQQFGVPMGFGGPHAGFMATRDAFKRQLPGRLVGVSRDSRGKPALRLSLGTREQHIRRERATSNICTAQALLANLAAAYAIYHGPDGLKKIAERIRALTEILAAGLERLGYAMDPAPRFDTVRVPLGQRRAADITRLAQAHRMNFRLIDDQTLGISLDETTTASDVTEIWQVFNRDQPPLFTADDLAFTGADRTASLSIVHRQSSILQHPVFRSYHSETDMLRYLKRLESKDLSLCQSMIPLGSCTMKLNAASEMLPVSWPEFARLHPFAPADQTEGYRLVAEQLEAWLAEITGLAGVSLQPNAGSQGEYAGLLAIRAYHTSQGQASRNVCLIPTSAHGTNPASAVMAGMRVVAVACDADGNIDLQDLEAKAGQHSTSLAALMVTYPSTHGVFEASIRRVCEVVHEHGGQVYMDGANMNAQVGLTAPGDIGADVCHLNLHKTFCIPHGGGGPGVGPICVAKHLLPFLPSRRTASATPAGVVGPVSGAPLGSAGILPIPWVYIRLMGAEGLREATQVAILNANYIAHRLQPYFPTLYRGAHGLVAHECILDLRHFKATTAEDVAKRLMDFGIHAPTLSWPVAGTLMVEPTESEPKAELDRFCDAMIAIHAEMQAVEQGAIDGHNNPLKQAPHTADTIASAEWQRPYSREQAAFPVPSLRDWKFWPAVGRVDNVLGDRNLVCSCIGMEAYATWPK